MIKNISIVTLEAAINRALAMDDASMERLQPLIGKTVSIHLKRPNVSLYFKCHKKGIELLETYDGIVDTQITTTLLTLLQLKGSKQTSVSLTSGKFHIDGDLDTAYHLDHLFRHYTIDWEEHLSRFVGDAFAYKLGQFGRRKKAFADKVVSTFKTNVTEYLQHETDVTPTSDEVDAFLNTLDQCKMDADRLEARLQALCSKIEGRHE